MERTGLSHPAVYRTICDKRPEPLKMGFAL
jgi:predicted DNA-binding transcriptional regulator AlpA